MKKLIGMALVICLIFGGVSLGFSAEKTEILTFQWDQPDKTLLEKWELHWGDTAGGPYVPLANFEYTGADSDTFESPIEAVVMGEPDSTVRKYFILKACGTTSDGYSCSEPSNEVLYDFKIPFGGYSAPIQFRIKTLQ